MPKLTKTLVEGAEVRSRDYYLWDNLVGFGVRIWPSGRRTYYVSYRNASLEPKRMKLAEHGSVTCEQARKLAMRVLGDVAAGEDPLNEKKTRRKSMKVGELCDRYMADAHKGLILGKRRLPKKPSTIATDRGRIDGHIKPLLGNRIVSDLRPADVYRFAKAVALGETSKVRKTGKLRGKSSIKGGKGAARRTQGLLGSIMSYAVREGLIVTNPVRGVSRQADGTRDRRLSDGEYRQIGDAIRAAREAEWPASAVVGVQLYMFTGCRLGEIEALRRDEIDEQGSCLRLSDSKEGRAIRIVGRHVFDVVRQAPQSPSPFVFPGEGRTGHLVSLSDGVERIMRRAGLVGITSHVMRHSYASVAADLGLSLTIIKAIMAWSKSEVAERYVHHADPILVQAANRVTSAISDKAFGSPAIRPHFEFDVFGC